MLAKGCKVEMNTDASVRFVANAELESKTTERAADGHD